MQELTCLQEAKSIASVDNFYTHARLALVLAAPGWNVSVHSYHGLHRNSPLSTVCLPALQ
jgi:hypothetical protein